VNLTEIFRNTKLALVEGGNLEIDNPNFDPNQPESPTNARVIQAQEIQLAPTEISDEVQDRTHMVGVLKNLFMDINKTFTVIYKTPLFNPAILDKEIKDFMAGSSQHFFDLLRPNPNFDPKQPESENNPKMIGLSDEEFKKYKPKVGDIDIQCNQDLKEQLLEFLTNHINVPIGNETLLGAPSSGNEQYNTLWQLADPPIKLQIDFEYGKYSPITQKPDEWTKFSHSSSWEDIQQNIKGVFHKYIYRALAKAAPEAKYIAKLTGLGKKRAIGLFGGSDGKEQFTDVSNPPAPFIDANFSFSVASKGGGGVRAKYKPVEPGSGIPTEINGLPVMHELKSGDSEYEQDLNKQFVLFFGKVPQGNDRSLQNSFLGTLELMNKYLDDNGKRNAASDFFDIVFEPGSQMLTKGDPQRDYATKFAAIDKMLAVLGLEDMKQTAETMARAYEQDYNDVEAFRKANPNEKQPRAAMKRQRDLVKEDAQVKAQFRKGMPHLHDLKPADLLDLLDEIHDGNGNFKLQNIPLNVKVDGFGGRFGKNSEGKPFMGTSRTEPRYEPGFVAYHEKKGTTDPEVLGRAQLFDELFNEMMNAVKLVDSKLGPGFLVNKQVTCEVLYLPFATETPEGKLKFVGIHYDKLPAGVKLALVPFRITDATTGEDLPNANKIVKELISAGGSGSVMFIDNSLTQNEALDVTALVPPVENIDELKAMLASNKLEARRQVKAALEPVAAALEKAIINDPNIIGKDLLGQDYEGIVINSRLGPIKVTSQEQRDVITAKNAAKVNARTERPRGEAKTAVVAIGSFIGHKGHEDLFKYTINKAKELGGDPYLFIGNAEGKNDPIPPSVKVQTWHKLYPQYAQNISTVNHEGGTLIQKIKHELINPLPGKPPRYDNIVIMVGEDRAGLTMPQALMKAVNKFQGYEHVKVSLEVTPREAGVSGTTLRNSLKNGPPEKALSIWSNAFDVNKLGVDWIKHLMDLTRKGMGIQEPQQPAQQKQPVPDPQTPAPVAEQRLFNSLIRPINEGTSIESTLRAIINDIGEPITSVYDTMKFQAKKYIENHGELGRGFRMVAAGVGGRWVQNMYIGRLHNELYDLTKYNTRRTVELRNFLRGEESDGEIEMKRSFGNLANNLPPILAKLGEQLNAPQLTRNAQRWMQNKAEYERYLMDLEAEGDEPDDIPVKSQAPKSNAVGQQNAQVDSIINNVLGKVPKSIAGDIRNAIARAPNKLAALKAELDRHNINMAEDRKKKNKKTSRSLSRYFFPGFGYYGGGESGEDGSEGGGESANLDMEEGYPNQQMSKYNPDGTTYRGSYNKMPTLDPTDPVHHADRYGPEHDEPYEMDYDKEDLKRAITKGMSDLSDNAKRVLELRFWDNLTLDEVAVELGVSRERIRQIEAKALRQLKHPTRSDPLRPFVQMAEAPKSAALRLGRAIQRVQGKTAASQARSVIPSSIPKPEPKKDEKIAEKLKTGPAAHFTPKDAHVKRGQFVGGDAGSVDEESTNDDDGVIGHMAKNLTGSGSPIAKIRHKRDTEREKRGSISYGYRQDPNLKTTHKQVPFSEDVENIMDTLINKIIINEAVSNNRK